MTAGIKLNRGEMGGGTIYIWESAGEDAEANIVARVTAEDIGGDKCDVYANLFAAAPRMLAMVAKMTERFKSLVALLETSEDDPNYIEDRKAIEEAESLIDGVTLFAD